MKWGKCWLWIVVLSLALGAQAYAQEDDTGSADDPWELPETKETESTEEEPVAEPEVVSPYGYSAAEIDRPLSLPRMMIEARGQLNIDIVPGDNWVSLRSGAGMGIINNLEAGLTFPLSVSPEPGVADLQLYGLYELAPMAGKKLKAAVRGTMIIPLTDDVWSPWWGADFAMLVDAPLKYRLNDMFALIGSSGLGFMLGKGNNDYFIIFADAGVLAQPTELLSLSMTLGVKAFMGDNSDALIPMVMRGQYTLLGDLDVFVDVGFLDLSEGADFVQLIFGAAYRVKL